MGIPPASSASTGISGARRHAAEILRMIDQVLTAARVPVAALSGIAVSDGPGSFTGLRIGWAAAKGLAQERELPLRALPAAMAVAMGAARVAGPGPVAVCFDALRGEVFGAVYEVRGESVSTIIAPTLLTVAELRRRAGVTPGAAAGDGALGHADDVAAWCGRAPLKPDELPLGAESLLRLVSQPDLGRAIDQSSEPVYGRPAEAQARWEARHGRALPGPTGRGG